MPTVFLDCKIKAVSPKGNQSWEFTGRTDAEAQTLWLLDVKNQLIRKDPKAGKDWRQEEKGTTEDEMVGWHHWHDGHEFEQVLGDGEGQEVWLAVVHGVTKGQTQLSNTNSNNNCILGTLHTRCCLKQPFKVSRLFILPMGKLRLRIVEYLAYTVNGKVEIWTHVTPAQKHVLFPSFTSTSLVCKWNLEVVVFYSYFCNGRIWICQKSIYSFKDLFNHDVAGRISD